MSQKDSPEAIAAANVAASLKQQKEQFVSHLLGGPIDEIYYVTTVSLTVYLTYSLLYRYQRQLISLPLDFSLQVVAILLCITLYSSNAASLHLIVGIPGVIVYFVRCLSKSKKTVRKSEPGTILPKKSFITAYRAHMLIITNLAILAVDFRVFPRRFAKVETWGTSMMDLGVGSFVFSMGLANSRSVIKQRFDSSKSQNYKFKIHQYASLISHSTVKALPVLALGFIRLVSVKTLEYQEHATEYGIHWNFFMTLGLLPIFLGILDPVLNWLPRVVVAVAIGIAYEVVLTKTDLLAFILTSDNRFNNLITMNKEGIFSFLGYLSIFIFGQSFGSFVLTGYKTPRNLIRTNPVTPKSTARLTGLDKWLTVSTTQGLVVYTLLSHGVFWYVQNSYLFGGISRRLANFPYVIWVVSYNSTLLLGYNMIESLVGKTESRVLNAVNNNGLANFLLANLGTGLVNLTLNTLSFNDASSFGILLVYSILLTTIAVVLDSHGIYIKL